MTPPNNELNWEGAEAHIKVLEKSCREIGPEALFYAGVLSGIRKRFDKGERSQEFYDEIMEMR